MTDLSLAEGLLAINQYLTLQTRDVKHAVRYALALLPTLIERAERLERPVDEEELRKDFSELWKAIETVQHKLGDKYHFDFLATRISLSDAHALCRPFWDKLNQLPSNLTDMTVGEEVADKHRAIDKRCDAMYVIYRVIRKVGISTITADIAEALTEHIDRSLSDAGYSIRKGVTK